MPEAYSAASLRSYRQPRQALSGDQPFHPIGSAEIQPSTRTETSLRGERG
ncbi:hypothetical protein AB0H49_32845 [Nocardia sp. NPDC050713]